METFKDKIEHLSYFAGEILTFDKVHMSDLIELKECCENIILQVNVMINDIVVDIDK